MFIKRFFIGLITLLLATGDAWANVRLPAIFGTNMVLQQDRKIPVWGWADPGEDVTVTFGTASAKATADAKGNWRVDLEPVPTASAPMTLTVKGKNTITCDNVLVGDVWVCSGQSNMEFDLAGNTNGQHGFGGDTTAQTAVPAANDPQLRLFLVAKKVAFFPETDVKGEWKVCAPEPAGRFSAVGYFFGKELRQAMNRPIGLIGTYWGGMPAQAFTSISGLQKAPPFTGYLVGREKAEADYPAAVAKYATDLADYQAKKTDWDKNDAAAFNAAAVQWKKDAAAAAAAHQPRPPLPTGVVPPPVPPVNPDGMPSNPAALFNGMIAPLIPYGIKGAIWYQGESNASRAAEYKTLFPRMISDWREKWGEGDFPFLFVQLAEFMAPQKDPSEGGWAAIRESQLQTLSLPNTGMATAIDLGCVKDIHPKDKLDVGKRLALAARHVAYGQDIVYSGPIYDSMKVEGNTIRLTFKHTGTGLKMGTPPWTCDGQPLPAPTALQGFAIAGIDQKFVWADAKIDGNTIVVSGNGVTAPAAVRYDWANFPAGNLYNNEDLPASPFRTDDWDLSQPPKPAPPKP